MDQTALPALVVDPDEVTSRGFAEALARAGFEAATTTSGRQALKTFHAAPPSLVVLDLGIADIPGRQLLRHFRRHGSHIPIIALTDKVDVRTAVEVVRIGASEVLRKSSSRENFRLAVQKVLPEALTAARREVPDRDRAIFFSRYAGLFHRSAGMKGVEALVMRLAGTEDPVLIQGEPGTGKALVAKAIHYLSARSGNPLQRVSCAALPADLLESEIFGPGGKLEMADGGTLLLDDVDDLPGALQPRILRILKDGQFFRAGWPELIGADVRLLATTTRDVLAMAADAFPDDLQRLTNVVGILVPPLRERREEIPGLVDHFRSRFASEFNRPEPELSTEIIRLFADYDWPGNVRELENLVKRWVVLGDDAHLQDELASRARARGTNGPAKAALSALSPGPGLKEIGRRAARIAEQAAVREALARVGGNRAAAARLLQVSSRTLLRKLSADGRRSGERA